MPAVQRWFATVLAATAQPDVANSLAAALRSAASVKVLNLHKSQDLLCHNLLCEKVGEACICRLSATLERLPALEELVLSSNQLTALPTSVWQLSNLKCLDISDNKLEQLPPEVANLRQLQVLDVRNNSSLQLAEDLRQALPTMEVLADS